jgi:hypothetical protein
MKTNYDIRIKQRDYQRLRKKCALLISTTMQRNFYRFYGKNPLARGVREIRKKFNFSYHVI